MSERSDVCKRIKKALRKRTGLSWSVTGGRGTAWGWLNIQAPKGRLICRDQNPNYDWHLDNYQDEKPFIERQATEGETAYYTSQEDREILAKALGLGMNEVSAQGVSISPEKWNFYLERAENGLPIPEPQPEVKEVITNQPVKIKAPDTLSAEGMSYWRRRAWELFPDQPVIFTEG